LTIKIINKEIKTMSNNNKLKSKLSIFQFHLERNKLFAFYLAAICIVGFISPAQAADWFKVGDIKANLIAPMYTLVNENLGYVAFAVGGAATFLARGQDMYQKGIAFGVGSLGTAGAVKLAQTVMNLG
jgi:hypothetical protein